MLNVQIYVQPNELAQVTCNPTRSIRIVRKKNELEKIDTDPIFYGVIQADLLISALLHS